MLEGLTCPKLGLIGPWAHEYPEAAVPGPQIGFSQECLRWWDYWLKGIDTGIMREPLLRAYLMESACPATFYPYRAGHWAAEQSWPSPQIQADTYWLHDDKLLDAPPKESHPIVCPSVQSHGLYAGVWCPFGSLGDLASDQQVEDGLSRCFTAAPVTERTHYLGFPEVTLTLSADQPLALVAIRLCDVAPDGASTLVSWGMLNLTHRKSHAQPTPLEPGKPYTVTVQLNAIGYTLPAGHCWRVAVAPTYWPHAWPSPQPVTLTLYPSEATKVVLPVRVPAAADELVTFLPSEVSTIMAREILRTDERQRIVEHDLINRTVRLRDYSDEGTRRLLPDGIEYGSLLNDTYTIVEGDPLSAHVRCERRLNLGRGDWQVRIETASEMNADATDFHLKNTLTAYEGDTVVFTRAWATSIVRDCL